MSDNFCTLCLGHQISLITEHLCNLSLINNPLLLIKYLPTLRSLYLIASFVRSLSGCVLSINLALEIVNDVGTRYQGASTELVLTEERRRD